jgi:sulfoacetaldehyde acetyltransferase
MWFSRLHTAQPVFTLAGYGIDYWPTDAKIIQSTSTLDRIGQKYRIGIVGDSAKVATAISAVDRHGWRCGPQERKAMIAQTKSAWAQRTDVDDRRADDPGTDWNQRARKACLTGWHRAWRRAIQAALPVEAIPRYWQTTAPSATPIRRSMRRKYLAPGLFVKRRTKTAKDTGQLSLSRYDMVP